MQATPNYTKYIGIPFVDRMSSYDGCDCWGLVRLFYKNELGISLPDYGIACDYMSAIDTQVMEEKSKATSWIKDDDYQPYSIVVMRFNSVVYCNHIGVYIGNGKFLHTARKTHSNITDITSPAWNKRIEGYYRYKGDEADNGKD